MLNYAGYWLTLLGFITYHWCFSHCNDHINHGVGSSISTLNLDLWWRVMTKHQDDYAGWSVV